MGFARFRPRVSSNARRRKVRSARVQSGSDEALVKAVFFDFDGVLTRDKTGSLTTLRYLSQRTGIAYEHLRNAFKPYIDDLNLGRTTHDEMWPVLCAALNFQMDKSLLRHAFESTPINSEMLELARMLRRHYFVGIITDNNKHRIDHLKKHLGLAALFDPIVVSAEVGSSKKTLPIFERALGHLGVAPSESVFIDNTEENLIAANTLGMKTVYFDDEESNVQALADTLKETYGLLIPSAA